MPIWVAYIAAPAVLLVITSKVIFNSDGPFVLTAMVITAGLFCALVLHGYTWLKGKLTRKESNPASVNVAAWQFFSTASFALFLIAILSLFDSQPTSLPFRIFRMFLWAGGGICGVLAAILKNLDKGQPSQDQ